jgi:hypothetical protein
MAALWPSVATGLRGCAAGGVRRLCHGWELMKRWHITGLLLAFVTAGLGCEGSGLGAPSVLADAASDTRATPDALPPSGPASRLAVLDRLGFAPEEPEGYSEGFDLDDLVSTESDPGGCYQPDLVGLDGVVGVDNTFGTLLPFFAVAGIGAAESLAAEHHRGGRHPA